MTTSDKKKSWICKKAQDWPVDFNMIMKEDFIYMVSDFTLC